MAHTPTPEPQPASLPGTGRTGDLTKPFPSAVLERRTTQHFVNEPIPAAFLDAILRLGLAAPSVYNLQPWRFVVAQEKETKARLQRALHDDLGVANAGAVIVAFGLRDNAGENARELYLEAAERGAETLDDVDESARMALDYVTTVPTDVWLTRQTMVALTTMMLAAETYGFNTALIEACDHHAIRETLGLPSDAEVVALLAVGHADGPTRPYPGRMALDEVVSSERFGTPFGAAANIDQERGP